VRRLRSAGAVFLGKTNVPEMMIVPFTESPTFGITRNPWDLQRTPGGSSGGSAAAVAAGLCSAALGSDGGGSIRIPAGCCGLFGLKPQRGRVPTAPWVEPWHGLSTWGAITRRVADSARFYDAIRDGGTSFVEAAQREPGRLRIALAPDGPPMSGVRADAEQLGGPLRGLVRRLEPERSGEAVRSP
jgi:amidase